jgi:hypothetical protein
MPLIEAGIWRSADSTKYTVNAVTVGATSKPTVRAAVVDPAASGAAYGS